MVIRLVRGYITSNYINCRIKALWQKKFNQQKPFTPKSNSNWAKTKEKLLIRKECLYNEFKIFYASLLSCSML